MSHANIWHSLDASEGHTFFHTIDIPSFHITQYIYMKHSLTILLLILSPLFTPIHAQTSVKQLVTMLKDFQQKEEVTPDSFYAHVHTLRKTIAAEQDSTSKAVYHAALAHIISLNAWRAQTYGRTTESHPDSIQEWSTLEYQQYATELYSQALRSPELLFSTPTQQWIPLVKRGKDEKIFGSNMLYVVWKAMRNDLGVQQNSSTPPYSNIISVYKQHGLSEAALRLTIDSIENHIPYTQKFTALRLLLNEYNQSPICALVYMKLAEDGNLEAEKREALLREALTKRPNVRLKKEIQNALLRLQQPQLRWDIPKLLYPGVEISTPLTVQNMQEMKMTVYRMPDGFEAAQDVDKWLSIVKKEGVPVQEMVHSFRTKTELDVQPDTLRWTTPDYGIFAAVVEGKTKAERAEKPQPQVQFFRTSKFDFFQMNLPKEQMRLVVVDAQSGKPLSDVKAKIYRLNDSNEQVLLTSLTSDERGIVLVDENIQKSRLSIELSQAEDTFFPKTSVHYGKFYDQRNTRLERHLHIFTDRSIYRPGQTIYVGGIAYSQKEWDAHVLKNEKYELIFTDANRQKLATHTLQTDEMGTLRDSLQLPEKCLPGRYLISIGNQRRYIQVEEYKRPTFEVKMDETPSVSFPVDRITLSGCAITYNNVPLSNARVTGTWNWQAAYPGRIGGISTPTQLDTIQTDAEGRFHVNIPVNRTAEELKHGMRLNVQLDVLSTHGETQQASVSLPLCSTPLRMWADIPHRQDKDRLEPWNIRLISSTAKPVEGNLLCLLSKDGKALQEFSIKANQDTLLQCLKDLPSGKYDLLAKANVKGDTASLRANFVLMSMQDTRLAEKTDLWVYTPCDTFSTERPARVQFGSSLQDAWLFCTLSSEDGLSMDTLLHLTDSLITWEIPYKKPYGQGARFDVSIFRDGNLQRQSLELHLAQPDQQLHLHWKTFRDFLRPGQQEEWILSVRRPDGTPAQANVLLSMYDASLDAISPHNMRLALGRNYFIPYLSILDYNLRGQQYGLYQSMPINIRFYKTSNEDFSMLNPEYFRAIVQDQLYLSSSPRKMNAMGISRSVQSESVSASAPMAYAKSTNTMMDRMDTDDDIPQEVEAETEETTPPTVPFRSNLSELAFFMPRLRTDAQGETTIAFTLPESMTKWHLLGVAHTADMMTGSVDEHIVAQKELMAELHLPRFARYGDQITIKATIRNISDKKQQGFAHWYIANAETGRTLYDNRRYFSLEALSDTVSDISFCIDRESAPLLLVRWTVEGETASDGEQRYLAIVSDMEQITETKAFSINGAQKWEMSLDKQFAKNLPADATFTVEYMQSPLWLAIQSLPSLAAPTQADVISLATSYYAGALAYHLAQNSPIIRQAVEEWSKEEDTLDSPLRKNQELTNIFLQETPWLMDAEAEESRHSRLAGLFREMEQESRRLNMLGALRQLQQPDGSFAWYPDMRGNSYLTTQVAFLLTRLRALTGEVNTPEDQVTQAAIRFLLKEMDKQVQYMKKQDNPTVGLHTLQGLYAVLRSGMLSRMESKERENSEYLISVLRKSATNLKRENRALAAIVLQLADRHQEARALMPELHTVLRQADGTYLAYPGGSFTSVDRKVQNHVLLMEAIRMIEPADTATLRSMQEWLIRQKRATQWSQPIQTADAIYALLSQSNTLPQNAPSDVIKWRADGRTRTLASPESTLGYLHQTMPDVKRPQKLTVEKHSDGISWGAVYAQYQIPASQVESQREGLNIRREISRENALQIGDRTHVRYVITADRDYDFVRLHAPRPSAAEPDSQTSGYRHQSGIGYYRAIHDSGSDFFIDRLPRGTYVLEEDWLMTHSGTYTLGPTSVHCLYAPEFEAHTAGGKLSVKE